MIVTSFGSYLPETVTIMKAAPGSGFQLRVVLLIGAPWGQVFLIAETSNSRVTLSLTRTPPVSSAAFQVMP